MLPLAVFGLLHGCHEWIEMFLISGWFDFDNTRLWHWLDMGLLVVSFSSLLVFGIWIISLQMALSSNQRARMTVVVIIYVLLVLVIGAWASLGNYDWFQFCDALGRYSLAVPGAAIAGIALQRQSGKLEHRLLKGLRPALQNAGWGFIIYALTQIFVSKQAFFPADRLNTVSFLEMFGFPIQAVRVAMAVIITVSLIWAAQLVDKERHRQFLAAQESRIETLNCLERELRTRESMRQDLLRHIVVAQEDERARISRELHDESAQILTAFSFHLAAIRNATPTKASILPQVEQLQLLCRQLSTGIYRLVRDLRPAQLDDLGLTPALQYQCDEVFNRSGLKVRLEVVGERRRLDKLVETVLYRVAQEALTNVARHAEVNEAYMKVTFQPDQVSLKVVDSGKGFHQEDFSPGRRTWGVEGMRERAESVDGSFLLHSTSGIGTEVEIIVPVANETRPLIK